MPSIPKNLGLGAGRSRTQRNTWHAKSDSSRFRGPRENCRELVPIVYGQIAPDVVPCVLVHRRRKADGEMGRWQSETPKKNVDTDRYRFTTLLPEQTNVRNRYMIYKGYTRYNHVRTSGIVSSDSSVKTYLTDPTGSIEAVT